MIKIFKRDLGDVSSKKAVKWLEENNLPYHTINLRSLSNKDLLQILKLSEGFTQILRSQKRSGTVYEKINNEVNFNELSMKEMIKLIQKNPSVLRTPIIFDDHNLVVGYNEDEIRVFIPRFRRELYFRKYI